MKFYVSCKYCDQKIEEIVDESYATNRGFSQAFIICDNCYNNISKLKLWRKEVQDDKS